MTVATIPEVIHPFVVSEPVPLDMDFAARAHVNAALTGPYETCKGTCTATSDGLVLAVAMTLANDALSRRATFAASRYSARRTASRPI